MINKPRNAVSSDCSLRQRVQVQVQVQVQSTDSQECLKKTRRGSAVVGCDLCALRALMRSWSRLQVIESSNLFDELKIWMVLDDWVEEPGSSLEHLRYVPPVRRPGQVWRSALFPRCFWHFRQFEIQNRWRRQFMQFTVQQSFNLEGYYATWHYIRLRILSQIEDRVKDHHLFLNVDFSFQRVLNISITKLKVQNWKLIEMEITEFEHTIENTKLKLEWRDDSKRCHLDSSRNWKFTTANQIFFFFFFFLTYGSVQQDAGHWKMSR